MGWVIQCSATHRGWAILFFYNRNWCMFDGWMCTKEMVISLHSNYNCMKAKKSNTMTKQFHGRNFFASSPVPKLNQAA